jgi:hypothetical protein
MELIILNIFIENRLDDLHIDNIADWFFLSQVKISNVVQNDQTIEQNLCRVLEEM